MKLNESTIEQELERFKTNDVTLSELTLAIERLQQTEQTNQAKVRKTNTFLGQLAQQLNLPGMFTLPSGRHFVYTNRGRVRTKSALPEYMTAEEVQPLAQRNLIPPDARTALAELISNSPGSQQAGDIDPSLQGAQAFPVEPPPPAAAITRQAELDAVDATSSRIAADPVGDIAQSHLQRFASSNKGGLANDPDEVDAIKELQRFLTNELELDTGGPDGRYGSKTASAVRQFQSALTNVVQDGDAGPETIGKIIEIRSDIARIRELVSAIEESAIPIKFKSGLAQLLEQGLTQAERTELEQLVNKYKTFRQAFPRFEPSLFIRAEEITKGTTAPSVSTDTPGQPAAPETDAAPTVAGSNNGPATTNSPAQTPTPSADNAPRPGTTTPGAPEVRSAAAVDVGDTPSDPEAATFVQDNPAAIRQLRTAIRGPGTDEDAIFKVLSTIRNQQQWDQLQREYQAQYRRDLVDDLVGDLGGIFNNINSRDMIRYVWDPLGRANVSQGSRIAQASSSDPAVDAQTDDAARATTTVQPVEPRPTGSGRNVRSNQLAWDRQYSATHNPDGTPKNAAPARTPANNTRAMDDRTLELIRGLGQ